MSNEEIIATIEEIKRPGMNAPGVVKALDTFFDGLSQQQVLFATNYMAEKAKRDIEQNFQSS
jgi:hypothetical protein